MNKTTAQGRTRIQSLEKWKILWFCKLLKLTMQCVPIKNSELLNVPLCIIVWFTTNTRVHQQR